MPLMNSLRDGSLSKRPLHLGNAGNPEVEETVMVGLAGNEAALARDVEDARVRLRENRFGPYEECGEPIASEGLKALPYVRH